tara:strand:+ start:1722 stop:3197 length:1476 start_codon:yes stop_codon:yes gene_type:complete
MSSDISTEKDLKDSLIYMMPLAVSMILPLITLPLFTRILSTDDFGLLALSLAFAIFANGLVNFGTTLAFERSFFEYSKDAKKLSQLFFSCLLFLNVNFLLIATLTFIFQDYISYLFTGSYEYGLFFFLAFIAQYFFLTITKNYYTYFRNSYRSFVYSRYLIINSLLHFGLSILFIVYFKVGVIGIIYSQLITGLIIFSTMSFLLRKELEPSLNRFLLIDILKISYPLTPRIFIGVINNQFNIYMVGLLANIGSAGIYDLAQKFSNLIFSLTTALENVFNPKIYDDIFHSEGSRSNAIGKYITPFFYYSAFLSIIVTFLAEEFIFHLIPIEFHPAISVLYALAIYPCILFFGKITSIQFLYKKKTFIISLVSILSLCLNIIINIPFIMKFGLIGAAYGTVVSSLITLIISIHYAQKHFYIRWEWKKILLIIVVLLFCLFGVIIIKQLSIDHNLIIVFKIFFIGLFIVSGIYLKILNRSFIQNLKEFGTQKRV